MRNRPGRGRPGKRRKKKRRRKKQGQQPPPSSTQQTLGPPNLKTTLFPGFLAGEPPASESSTSPPIAEKDSMKNAPPDLPRKSTAKNQKPRRRTAAAPDAAPSLLLVALSCAMAGGMGWGIRGQHGPETGTMIAGVLVGLVLAFFFCRQTSSLSTARAVALMTVAIGFGGSMTYDQTVGLTHEREFIGNSDALAWGLAGLFIKGSIWIAFASAFLGIGLSRTKYRPTEITSLLLLMIFLLFLGVFLINRPFDPANEILPKVYFSDHWFWEPDRELKPRPERWGGLLCALIGVIFYVSLIKRDKLAQMLTLFGFLAGGFGFALGQCVQAFNAWHPDYFRTGFFDEGTTARMIVRNFNWQSMMETSFGAIWGAILGLGVWLNRGLIQTETGDDNVELSSGQEWLLILVHVVALLTWDFLSYPAFDQFADHAITMGFLPIFGIMAGRFWPYMVALPIVVLPIAGKTIRHIVYGTQHIEPDLGWLVYGVIPVALALVLALVLYFAGNQGQSGRQFARWTLLFTAWVFFLLNFAFFEFSWPWVPLDQWTDRTPNTVLFTIALFGITLVTLLYGWRKPTTTP